jgi:drug/metabolite transporter (DMT)-like permease
MGAIVIFLAAAALSYHPGVITAEILGIVAMVAACLSWAIDNNLTQRLSLRDPVAVTRIKTLGAGTCTLALALIAGESLPRPSIIGSVLAVGVMSYGLSLVLDTQALRLIGAAREATFFATAPFIGAVAAVPILGERWGLREFVAAGIMAIGILTLLREHHSHEHSHSEIEHDHIHVHGEHHNHTHDEAQPAVGAHAHLHRHVALAHDHPHVSEIHHRHEHY